MKMNSMIQEQISAMVDGELDDKEVATLMATLRQQTDSDEWDIYHHIGDALRSDEMALSMSAGFAASMAARLEAEPTVIAPSRVVKRSSSFRRFALPAAAAAAAVATATVLIGAPQMLVASRGDTARGAAPTVMLASASANPQPVSAAPATIGADGGKAGTQMVVLRDPRIDSYLMAHQRFSPSLYSTAQYARSAAFASDAE